MTEQASGHNTPNLPAEPRENGLSSSPPSPSECDLKLSRKREREVSLEPATPKAEVAEADQEPQEPKDRRTPAKKNRVHLDATEEEEDTVPGAKTPPSTNSPPLSISPPHEIKVRQISQGVEDLNWQNPLKVVQEADRNVDDDPTSGDADAEDVPAEEPPVPEVPPSAKDKDATVPPDSADSSQDSAADSHEDDQAAGTSPLNEPVSLVGRPDSDSDGAEKEKEKGLKRKFGARAISGNLLKRDVAPEPLKRQRDDSDKDDNPRETKRPSPPPESESSPSKEPSSDSAFKLSGFMAYATSSASPFAAVKGRNIFKKVSPTSPSLSPSSSSSSPFPTFASAAAKPSMPPVLAPDETKQVAPTVKSPVVKLPKVDLPLRSGSPPASVRSKSPPLGSGPASKIRSKKSPTRRANPANVNAFSSYATGGVQGFHVPKRARPESPSGGSSRSSLERNPRLNATSSGGAGDSGADDEEENKPLSFGEKLRAGKDKENEVDSGEEKSKLVLTEKEISTGEEEEETIYQVRGKLFVLSSEGQWKERGTGTMKLNARKCDGSGARLVMRKEAVYTLLLNCTLFRGMRCFLAQDPRYLRFSIIEDNGATKHYNLRVASAKVAQELLDEINAYIPITTEAFGPLV